MLPTVPSVSELHIRCSPTQPGLQREKQCTLENQIRRARTGITAVEPKRRTRQLILIGSVVKRKADENPKTKDWLNQALDELLDRSRRVMFVAPPRITAICG